MATRKAGAPKVTKQTRNAIAFFNGKKSAVELLEEVPFTKVSSPATRNELFWDFMSDNAAYFGLVILTVAFSFALYTLIEIGGSL